jgi:hypothetical protein
LKCFSLIGMKFFIGVEIKIIRWHWQCRGCQIFSWYMNGTKTRKNVPNEHKM